MVFTGYFFVYAFFVLDYTPLFCNLNGRLKKKVKGHMWGLSGTAGCRPIVPLPQWVPLIHLQRRHAPHRYERPLLAKEGTRQGILLAHRNSRRYQVLLHAAKLGHGTDPFTSPPKEGMRRIFKMPEKSNDFSRVWTRELGYQSMPNTRPPKPSKWQIICIHLNLLLPSKF